jgi:DNA-binding winged helix-turn-helix (wHTH) protein
MQKKSLYAIFGRKSGTNSWYLLFETNEYKTARQAFNQLSSIWSYDDLRLQKNIKTMDNLSPSAVPTEFDQGSMLPFIDDEVGYDSDSGITFVRGKKIFLTKLEIKLLRLLESREGKIVQKALIFEALWGEKYQAGSKDDGKIEKLVSRLRQKIEEHSDRKHIKTHRGVGYRYKKEGFR